MDELIEEMAKSIAEAMNGGKFSEDVWYSETARKNWREAVRPWAERLDEAILNRHEDE